MLPIQSDASYALGLDLAKRAPEHESVVQQVALLQELLAEGVGALAFVGTEDDPFDDLLCRAGERGVVVVAFDLDASRSERSVFVGMTDPERIGRQIGARIAAEVGSGATVLPQAGSDGCATVRPIRP